MTLRDRCARHGVIPAATLLSLVLYASAVEAAVVVTDAPVFVVTISGADTVTVDCAGGKVRVSANAAPTVYTTDCSAVTALSVTAVGAFANTIDLSAVSSAAFTVLASTTIDGGDGNDTITGSALPDTINGGGGDDTINGGAGADTIDGGAGNDAILGGTGADVMNGGADTDTLTWNPGDGSDTVDGGTGSDTLIFNGAAAVENFVVSANGAGYTFTRDVGSIVMQVTTTEILTLQALGGNDTATVNNLSGVGSLATINLFMGDGADNVNASGQLSAAVTLLIDGGDGDDSLTGSPQADTMNGGAGNDTISGLGGVDIIDGGAGNDAILGGPGNETIRGGADTDTITWNPGDGSDTVDGGSGADTLVFNGAAGNEVVNITQPGAQNAFQLTRDVGAIVMIQQDVESLVLNMLGGDDTVTTVGLFGISQALDGGSQVAGDTLNVNTVGGPCAISEPGSFLIPGRSPITFTDFEAANATTLCTPVPVMNPMLLVFLGIALTVIALSSGRLRMKSSEFAR